MRLRGCGGWIERNGICNVAAGGVFSTDAAGLVIADNRVERCGDNGIQIWRSTRGDDATRVSGNRVSDIRNVSGGTGQYGNGISIFRAGGVVVAGNTIRRCAYTAVRNNGGAGVVISGNTCADLGETAIFAEFEFEGCVIADNSIDGAVCGVQMVNFADHGGRAAVCSGNVIRNLKPSQGHSGHEFGYECGVKVEADATVGGNVIEGAAWVGVLVGWGASLGTWRSGQRRARRADRRRRLDRPRGGRGGHRRQRHLRREPGRDPRDEFRPAGHRRSARGAAAPPQLRISGNQAT